jgi:hypothetical protein
MGPSTPILNFLVLLSKAMRALRNWHGSLASKDATRDSKGCFLLSGRGRGLAQGDEELGLIVLGGVVEGVAGAVAIAGFEEQSALDTVGKAGEAGFAVDVGADLEVKLVGARESVGNVDLDLGEINRFVVGVGDGEVGRAGAQAAVDDGDRFGVWGLSQAGGGEDQS